MQIYIVVICRLTAALNGQLRVILLESLRLQPEIIYRGIANRPINTIIYKIMQNFIPYKFYNEICA